MKQLSVSVADFGLARGLDGLILAACRNGIATGTSLLVTMPGCLEAVDLLREEPDLAVGLHLNLSEGAPLSAPETIPSLIGRDGRLHDPGATGRPGWTAKDVQRELAAQADAFLATGRTPSHLDGHGRLARDATARAAAERLAERLGVPLLLEDEPGRAAWAGSPGPAAWLLERLREPWQGLRTLHLRLCGGGADDPVSLLQALCAGEVRDVLREEGIALVQGPGPGGPPKGGAGEEERRPPQEPLPPSDRSEYDRGYDTGYDAGFDAGYNAGHDAGHADGSQVVQEIGYLAGIGQATYADEPLPLGYALSDLVGEAARHLAEVRRGAPSTLRVKDVYQRLASALSFRSGLSVVAVTGDGLAALQADAQGDGADSLHRQLGDALRRADIVGVPVLHHFERQPEVLRLLLALEVPIAPLHLTDAAIAYFLVLHGLLRQLLLGHLPQPRVLVLGEAPDAVAAALKEQGALIAGTAAPGAAPGDLLPLVSSLDPAAFDLALVSAGIHGAILCAEIADRLGRAALDIGTVAPYLARGWLRL